MNVKGKTHTRFKDCREAMEMNLSDGHDLGCGLAVVRDDEMVVDIWGGHTDAARTRNWQEDTLVNIWSVTKSVAATAIAIAVERGLVRYDAPVSDVWPEFAAGGKESITLDLIMSHQAGLNGLDSHADMQAIYDWHPYVEALAAMKPLWQPGSRCAYHALSYGHLAGEVLRRTDGRMPGEFIRDEIAAPLELDLHVSLPESEDHRVAEMTASDDSDYWCRDMERNGYPHCLHNPDIDPLVPNERAWRAADIPAGNGQTTARALATLFGALAHDGGGILSPEGLGAATAVRFSGDDVSLGYPARFAAGYALGGPDSLLGRNPRSFGHTGWGGSFAFADPDTGLGVSYVTNRMLGDGENFEIRHTRMLRAIYNSL